VGRGPGRFSSRASGKVRLGGFVLFRDNVATLGACLESLQATCDEIVAIDTGARDGSSSLAAARGVRVEAIPWRGYGDARARAAAALPRCDYLFFLDSDEHLEAKSIEALRAVKGRDLGRPSYRVRLRDWVLSSAAPYVYRCGTRHRLVRQDCCRWRPEMIVHESLELPTTEVLPVTIEHAFLTPENDRPRKDERYAFLWALRAYCRGARAKLPTVEGWAIALRDLLPKGALWRGGAHALRAAAEVSRYHRAKYLYLRRFHAGEFRDAVDAHLSGRWEQLFAEILPRWCGP
jgi:hypothetical protein